MKNNFFLVSFGGDAFLAGDVAGSW